MFEYLCEHIIPGCTTRETGDTKDAAREKARAHLREHHDMPHVEAAMWEKIDLAIAAIRSR